MITAAINQVHPARRDELFSEICRIVREVTAQDRSLNAIAAEGFDIDEGLEAIADLLGDEIAASLKEKAA